MTKAKVKRIKAWIIWDPMGCIYDIKSFIDKETESEFTSIRTGFSIEPVWITPRKEPK